MQNFSPYAALEHHAERQSQTDAIVLDGESISYGEMVELVTTCADWLVGQGVNPGQTVGISIRNDIGHIVCATTLFCLGVPQISLGSHENPKTRRRLAIKVGAANLIVEKIEPWMEGLRTNLFPGWRALSSTGLASRAAFAAPAPGSVALYRNTSGSTNVPKTFEVSYARMRTISEIYGNDPKERRTLRSGSIEFDANRIGRICSLLAGNTCIIATRLNASDLISVCERADVTMVLMGAYKLGSLLADISCRRLPNVTAIMTGGSRVPGRLRREVKALLTDKLWVQYATSEIGLISVGTPDQHDAFPEGVGVPDTKTVFEIVGPDDHVVEPGSIGEIRVRKEIMTAGYIAEPVATPNFREGWFYPGDLVSQGLDEPLVFHGRADDAIMLNSINIFPAAIEDVLESHADVEEAAAYPVRSRLHGEIPAAAVVLSPQARGRDTNYLLEFCRKSLGVRAPRQIVAVDRIPRNAVGKPLRRELPRG